MDCTRVNANNVTCNAGPVVYLILCCLMRNTGSVVEVGGVTVGKISIFGGRQGGPFLLLGCVTRNAGPVVQVGGVTVHVMVVTIHSSTVHD